MIISTQSRAGETGGSWVNAKNYDLLESQYLRLAYGVRPGVSGLSAGSGEFGGLLNLQIHPDARILDELSKGSYWRWILLETTKEIETFCKVN